MSVVHIDILKNKNTHWVHKPVAHLLTLQLSKQKNANNPAARDVLDLLQPSTFWSNIEKCNMCATPNGPNHNKVVSGRQNLNMEILCHLIQSNASDATICNEIDNFASLTSSKARQEVHCETMKSSL